MPKLFVSPLKQNFFIAASGYTMFAGVFMFVGQSPHDEPVRGLVEAAKGGWIKTNDEMETSVEGIFAAGDVRDTSLRQVVTAAGDGARAAMSAYAYLQR